MMRFSSFCLIVLLAGGCAQLVTKHYKPKRGGVVKYSTGWMLGDKNRAKAMELAAEHCSPGKVSVLSEDNRVEFTGTTSTRGRTNGDNFSSETTQGKEGVVYIKFACVR